MFCFFFQCPYKQVRAALWAVSVTHVTGKASAQRDQAILCLTYSFLCHVFFWKKKKKTDFKTICNQSYQLNASVTSVSTSICAENVPDMKIISSLLMRVKDNQSITFIDNYLRLTQCGKRKCWHNHKHTLHKRLSSLVRKATDQAAVFDELGVGMCLSVTYQRRHPVTSSMSTGHVINHCANVSESR